MNLVGTIARASLFRRPGRTIFAVLGIAVGIAVVICVFTLDHCTILGLSEAPQPEWKAEVEVSPSVKVVDPKKELEQLPGVAHVTAYFQQDIDVRPGEGKDPKVPATRVRFVALETASAGAEGVYRVVQGEDLKLRDKRNEVMVGEPLAKALGLTIGSYLTLSRPPRGARATCIDGEYKDVQSADTKEQPKFVFKVCGILAKENLGARAAGEIVVCDYARGQELFKGSHVNERFVIKRDPKVDVERLQQGLGAAFSYELNQRVIIGQAADERAFRNGVRIAGFMALVLGLFVIFHTLSIALVERLREIATLNALGATKPQIIRVFFTEALYLAGAGALLGAALGLAMTWFLLSKGVTSIGLGKKIDVFDVPWGTVAALAIVGAGIALLGSIYPLLRIRDTKTDDILRGSDRTQVEPSAKSFRRFTAVLMVVILPAAYFTVVPVVGELRSALLGTLLLGLGTMALLVGLPLLVPEALVRVTALLAAPFKKKWPLAGMMAAKSMQETPARIAVATVGIAMVTAGFVSLKGMTNSLRGEVENWAAQSVDDKVFIREIGDLPFQDVADGLKKHPDVIGVERADARTYVPFLIIGVDPDQLLGYGPCATDANVIDAMRRGDGMILTGRLARDRGYTVGSSVLVPIASGKVQEFKVCAIAEDYGYYPQPDERMYGVVNESALKRYFCINLEKVARVAVRFKSGTNVTTAAAEIKKLANENFPGAIDWRFESGARVRLRRTDDIDYDFLLFDIIIGLTAMLAGLGVLNGQLLAAMERIKEYGILKALGASPGQITGMAMLENAVIGTVGGALGCAIGLVLTPIIVRAVAEISAFDVPQRSAGALIPMAFGGAIVLAILAGLYPVRKMNALSAAHAIRTGG